MSTELELVREQNKSCVRCGLRQGCLQVVPGIGSAEAKLMIVGEAPGEDEDSIGEPFVGRSGKLLNKLLTEANISREVIYITNSVRCRPPHNRLPSPEEISACKIWLWREIQLIQPKVIMPLGHVPSTLLLKKSLTMGKMKGNVYELDYCKAKLMPWYHPSYLLRQGSKLDEDTVKWFRKVKENL